MDIDPTMHFCVATLPQVCIHAETPTQTQLCPMRVDLGQTWCYYLTVVVATPPIPLSFINVFQNIYRVLGIKSESNKNNLTLNGAVVLIVFYHCWMLTIGSALCIKPFLFG